MLRLAFRLVGKCGKRAPVLYMAMIWRHCSHYMVIIWWLYGYCTSWNMLGYIQDASGKWRLALQPLPCVMHPKVSRWKMKNVTSNIYWLVSFFFSDWVSVWAIHNSHPAESSGGRLESLEFFPQDRAKFWESKSLRISWDYLPCKKQNVWYIKIMLW